MRNCHDQNLIVVHFVDDSIRKAVQPVASDAAPEGLPCPRVFEDFAETCMDLGEELAP
jgi:hypothetical protein